MLQERRHLPRRNTRRVNVGAVKGARKARSARTDPSATPAARNEIADLPTLDDARYLRIRALLRSGRADEALRWGDNGFFRIGGNPLYAPSLAHVKAEAHDALGSTQRARELYATYLRATERADDDMRANREPAGARLQQLMRDTRGWR